MLSEILLLIGLGLGGYGVFLLYQIHAALRAQTAVLRAQYAIENARELRLQAMVKPGREILRERLKQRMEPVR